MIFVILSFMTISFFTYYFISDNRTYLYLSMFTFMLAITWFIIVPTVNDIYESADYNKFYGKFCKHFNMSDYSRNHIFSPNEYYCSENINDTIKYKEVIYNGDVWGWKDENK